VSATTVRTAATVTSVGYAALLAAFGQTPTASAKQAVAFLPAAVGLLALAFDKWAWNWPLVWLVSRRPRIYGTWRAQLTPSDDSRIPKGGNRGPIQAYVVIAQTFWTVHVTLHTAESSSWSTAAALRDEGGGRQVLAYVYGNRPRQEHLRRSPEHTGASEIVIVGPAPTESAGSYWTNRLTRGDMDLTLLDRRTDRPTFAACTAADSTT
jgi:hypothetical protein